MARRSKKFEFAEGVYYFNINKGYRNDITIKRKDKTKAIRDYKNYIVTQKGNCQWLGKWNGKSFVEDNFEAVVKKKLEASVS